MKNNTHPTYTVQEALKKMEYYCAYQERSHKQVEQKLWEMRMIPDAIDLIVLHLIQHNFLNEERFAQAYVRGKFAHKQWGKQKIIQGLKQQDIHPKLIQKALEEIDPEAYNETIIKLIEKKNKDYAKDDLYKRKQKIIRFLYQKGYFYDEFSGFLGDVL